VEGNGKIDKYQEGLGVSFAIMFGIVNKKQAQKILQSVQVSNYGITSIYTDFPRFSKDKPGRHNNLIWPMVNGFFAKASIIAGDRHSFNIELDGLTHLAIDEDKGDYQFREIYNPNTGQPFGGWQNGSLTQSCRLQTWSATAYINMVDFGMIGFRFKSNGIIFSPYLPPTIHLLSIKNIRYRNAVLNITVKGNGTIIQSFTVNGKQKKDASINDYIRGENNIIIQLI
jgi:glycogen debranching enzyme